MYNATLIRYLSVHKIVYIADFRLNHTGNMASDGNDRRVYVGNLPPDIRTKVLTINKHQLCLVFVTV